MNDSLIFAVTWIGNWYWSIVGSAILCAYIIFRRDPVGVHSYLPNSLVYLRNLHLIRKQKLAPTAAAPTQTPREES